MASKDSAEHAKVPTEDEHDQVTSSLTFPVVGIGASAGGLEAFDELLRNLPPSPGLAILYVAHLEPHHKSHLQEILAKVTGMSVHEGREGMPVEVNHIYVIPPGSKMALSDGKLVITPRSERGLHMPIDHLFRSMAATQKNRAVAVILSGGGTDGTLGFEAVKAEGGITITQDEATAVHPDMPRSAAREGNVDYTLRPREIAGQLVRLAHHPYATQPLPAPLADGVAEEVSVPHDQLGEVFSLLRALSKVDFTHYKPTTINRRIQRRMLLRECGNLNDYVQLLHRDRPELDKLYSDLLICVTQFFRDPETFEVLKAQVIPDLLKGRTPAQPLRIWVAGCATGEEVYSIAMVILECLDHRAQELPVKILATDLNEEALEKARAGTYIDNIEIDVSPERLRRFFHRTGHHYQISKAVRDLCVFSRHNLVSDPPFGHIDLVSCRNVLIYMDASLQKRVLPILHYALNPEGFLLLGSSESVGKFTELFTPTDTRHRIFRKVPSAHPAPIDFGAFATHDFPPRTPLLEEGPPSPWSALDVQREADRIALTRYAPVGVVVDETMTVLQFRGRTVPYLEPAPGLASLDLFRMLREGLLADVRAAVNQARAENAVATREGPTSGTAAATRIEVIPFRVPPAGVRFFLISFGNPPTPAGAPAPPPPPVEARPPAEGQTAALQQELAAVRDYLQSVIEEHESANEELKSANEEIMSSNEELQSTNEELQTAKEEAQSANEELATVNDELRHRNAELAHVNNDLVNLLNGVGMPIVMVGSDLRIRRFTPPAEKLFRLIDSDLGRPIRDISPNLNVPDLAGLIAQVIDSVQPLERRVKDGEGRYYRLRVRPYITLDRKVDGASVVLVEEESIAPGETPAAKAPG